MRILFYNSNGNENYGAKKSVLDDFGKEVANSRDAVNDIVKQQQQGASPKEATAIKPKK